MPQLFRPDATKRFRALIILVVVGAASAVGMGYLYARSDAAWNVGEPAEQPIPFRHDLHAGQLGVDCRYCHSSVEQADFAGMPSAQTCMTCHSQVWPGASVLEPLRSAIALEQPIVWNALHNLPDFARFHHGVHVSTGIPCSTCHGDVAEMSETVKTQTLSMGWCLECHRDPGAYYPPSEAAASLARTTDRPVDPVRMLEVHNFSTSRLTDCNTCHY